MKNKVIKKSNSCEDLVNELFIDKDNHFKVNTLASLVALVVGGICLYLKKLSEDSNKNE